MASMDNFYCMKLLPSYEYGPGFQPAQVADFCGSLAQETAQAKAKQFIQHQLEIPHEHIPYFSKHPMVVYVNHPTEPLLVLAQYVDAYRASGGRQKLSFLFLWADTEETLFGGIQQQWSELEGFSPFPVSTEIKTAEGAKRLTLAVKQRLFPPLLNKVKQLPLEEKIVYGLGLVGVIVLGAYYVIPVTAVKMGLLKQFLQALATGRK
jgi:hypothetical protein